MVRIKPITDSGEVGRRKEEKRSNLFWPVGIALALGLVFAGIFSFVLPNSQQPATEKNAKLTGFAFAAVGPASIIPENAHDKIVSVSASERYAVTIDATASSRNGLKFKNWVFEDGGTNPSLKTGFCLPSDYYKAGDEMKIKAIAVDGQGKIVEDEIKIIFH